MILTYLKGFEFDVLMDHVTLRHQWKFPEAQKEGLIEDN